MLGFKKTAPKAADFSVPSTAQPQQTGNKDLPTMPDFTPMIGSIDGNMQVNVILSVKDKMAYTEVMEFVYYMTKKYGVETLTKLDITQGL